MEIEYDASVGMGSTHRPSSPERLRARDAPKDPPPAVVEETIVRIRLEGRAPWDVRVRCSYCSVLGKLFVNPVVDLVGEGRTVDLTTHPDVRDAVAAALRGRFAT